MADETLAKAQAAGLDAKSVTGVVGYEAELVERCVGGDDRACAELVEAHERLVLQLGCHLLGNRDEATDLAQDVFLRVFRTLGSFRGQSALRTWIFRIVINQARNRRRWWRRRHWAEQISLDQHVALHGDFATSAVDDNPGAVLARKDLADRVWGAVEALPFEQRSVVVLREVEDLSYQEIAFALGVTIGTVKSRLTRARQRLRAALQEPGR